MGRAVALCVALAALGSVEPAASGDRSPLADLPRLTLWAWERPEDLRSLPDDVGVAFLAQTVVVRDAALQLDPRRQPLRVGPSTPLIAVTRIEIPPRSVALDDTVIAFLATGVARTATLPRVTAVQIDFDAVASQRNFYRDLVGAVRAALPAETRLSITALASWCQDDRWIAGLPIDEAVPMFFRMGPGAHRLDAPGCPGALGLSLDEPLDVQARGRRVYVFNPRPWTLTSIDAAQRVSR